MKSHRIFSVMFTCLMTVGCTDLDAPVYDQQAKFWRTAEEIESGVALAYVGLRNYSVTAFWEESQNVYILNENTTDEIIVPNRVNEWADRSMWEELWKHTWSANSFYIKNGWSFVYTNVSNINSIIEGIERADTSLADIAEIKAELKTLRAFYYYQGLDLFGNIPISKTADDQLKDLVTRPRAEVFDFVEAELQENMDLLSADVNLQTYGKATRWFSLALLAKLYLNAEVFTGTARWQECADACNKLLNSGKFALEEDFFRNFAINNEGSRENIFSIPFDRVNNLNLFFLQVLTLHYNSAATFDMESAGANGFCSTAEYLALFDDNDYRKKMFLVGQQYLHSRQYADVIPDPVNAQQDRNGNPLIFDPVITTFQIPPPKSETAGARCAKWEFNKTGGGNMSNDFAVFRLADIILMKAEAQLRMGDGSTALATINQKINGVSVRSRAGLPDFTADELTLENLLKERARELSWEGHRRNDLIRFGHFTDARIPEKLQSEKYRELYPIPQDELLKNRNLKQNPGY